MKLAIGNDHVAVEMKNEIMAHLESRGIEVINVGTDTPDRFNYPVSGYKVAKMVANGEVMYRKSLEAAVEGQNKAREALSGTLPDKRWTFDG